MRRYLIKKSQIVAIVIFLAEILGTLILTQINTSEKILEKIGCVALVYCFFSIAALYHVKKTV